MSINPESNLSCCLAAAQSRGPPLHWFSFRTAKRRHDTENSPKQINTYSDSIFVTASLTIYSFSLNQIRVRLCVMSGLIGLNRLRNETIRQLASLFTAIP